MPNPRPAPTTFHPMVGAAFVLCSVTLPVVCVPVIEERTEDSTEETPVGFAAVVEIVLVPVIWVRPAETEVEA